MKNILLLQGPFGPFFAKFDHLLRLNGFQTWQIGFNFGDEFFAQNERYTAYRGKPDNWQDFFTEFVTKNHIHAIFLIGDCRFYHQIAIDVCEQLNIRVFVFEEGYLRPNFITCESNGVNGKSHLMQLDASFYKNYSEPRRTFVSQLPLQPFLKGWIYSVLYYNVKAFGLFLYPHHIFHRPHPIYKEFFYGWRNAGRKILFLLREVFLRKQIKRSLSKKFFLATLQTNNDFQVRTHSHYTQGQEAYIREVIASFAEHANPAHSLIFKHHPYDRGRKIFDNTIHSIAKEYAIEKRVYSTHELRLPSLLSHAVGTVTINSTVGISALLYNSPVMVMGRAIYDLEGLTNNGTSLDSFWRTPRQPDPLLRDKFFNYLINTNQYSGSFYSGFSPDFQTIIDRLKQ